MVILGTPRSGTSLLAGLLADAGFDPGPDLIPSTPDNPRGFFESLRVNRINDELLVDAVEHDVADGALVPPKAQRWLAALGGPVVGSPAPEIVTRMDRAIGRSPYVLKDPRLSYTAALWEPVLGDAVYLCTVRHPGEVVDSIRSMVARDPDTFGAFDPPAAHLEAMWTAVHRSVLMLERRHPITWVHFDDLVHGDAIDRVAAAVSAPLAGARRDRTLHRSRPRAVAPATSELHDRLRTRCRTP